MLLFFSILAVAIYRIVAARIQLAGRMQQYALSESLAYSVCTLAVDEVKNMEAAYHSLGDLTGQRSQEYGNAVATYYYTDEEGRLDINFMPKDVIELLPEMDEELAVEITESPLRPYQAVEELLMLEDMELEIYNAIRDFITVNSTNYININTASEEVLLCLGIDSDIVEAIVSYRLGPDGVIGTEDDGIFESKAAIVDTLKSYTGMYSSQEQEIIDIINKGWLDTKSETFCLRLNTQIAGKKGLNYDIILDKDGVIEWRER